MYKVLRVGFPILLIVLIILACGGVSSTPEVTGATETTESSPTAVPTPTYTPTPPLSAETYALRMEAITLFPPGAEKIVDDLFRALYSPQTVVRLEALFTKEQWTEDDAQFASEYAKHLLEVVQRQHGLINDYFMRAFDEAASLTPPESMRDAHDEVVATNRALMLVGTEVVEWVVNETNTDLRSAEALRSFSDTINVMDGSGILNLAPGNLIERGDALDEQRYLACEELNSLLWDAVGRYVDIGICE